MQKSLDRKLAAIHADPSGCREFIIADAKDADMAFGLGAPGLWWGLSAGLTATAVLLIARFRRVTRTTITRA